MSEWMFDVANSPDPDSQAAQGRWRRQQSVRDANSRHIRGVRWRGEFAVMSCSGVMDGAASCGAIE